MVVVLLALSAEVSSFLFLIESRIFSLISDDFVADFSPSPASNKIKMLVFL